MIVRLTKVQRDSVMGIIFNVIKVGHKRCYVIEAMQKIRSLIPVELDLNFGVSDNIPSRQSACYGSDNAHNMIIDHQFNNMI